MGRQKWVVRNFSILKFSGAPGGIRTPGLLVRSQTLYPTELQAHIHRNLTNSLKITTICWIRKPVWGVLALLCEGCFLLLFRCGRG